MKKQKLYIHTGRATHFLSWEIPEFKRHFILVRQPHKDVPLLCFGPDVLREASLLPASKKFAVLFPGFGHNPLYNKELLESQTKIITQKYDHVFINKGPLQIAYKDLPEDKISIYPFSIDTTLFKESRIRSEVKTLLHVSNDAPQKDWKRSEEIMRRTGLSYDVYPPRIENVGEDRVRREAIVNKLRRLWGQKIKQSLPVGYVSHEDVIEKYYNHDGFVHVAQDIHSRVHIDGKYTASFIEAGMSGAILFWHDTFNLGNDLKTVFELPLDPEEAAKRILDIVDGLNVKEHSLATRNEMLETFNPEASVRVRAEKIKSLLLS